MEHETATFGAAEVCFAADLPRPRFHAWVARQFIAPGPGPGMGIARRFSLVEATKIAVMAELGRLGVPAGMAAGYAAGIPGDCVERPTFLVLQRRQKGIPAMGIVRASTAADVAKALPRTQGLTILDLTMIATDTKRILQDPMTRHRADMRTRSGWEGATGEKVRLEVYDPSAQDAPAKPRERKRKLEPV